MWITGNLIFLLTFLLAGSEACGNVSDGWKQVGLEERAKRSSIVFHGLAIETLPVLNDQFSYAVQFWLINVYKGSESVGKFLDLDPGSGGVFNLRDRKINVTGFSYKSKCQGSVAPQKYYIIFTELVGNELVAKFDDLFGASAEWSERNERRVWRGVGWDNWSDWGTCSTSCGEGSQERTRKCILKRDNCRGYNKERRRCNMFSCQGAVDPMRLDDRRFFHSSRGEWQRVPGRPAAWRLRPNSYVWVPSSQIFPNKTAAHRLGVFPREFSLLVTLKLSPKKPMQGILFSLRSRREQNAYLSLELESPGRVRVVHSGKNGTQSVIIPMKLNDGHWHQLSIALQDDNSVRSFFDCSWISTDILKRNELDHPEDADLIIGYLFQGELEQLMIVPNPGAVAQQCSSTKIPIFDPNLLRGDSANTTKAAESSTEKKGKKKNKPKIFVETEQEIVKNYRKGIDLGLPDFSKENGKGIASEESKESDDDGGGGDAAEGSGNGNPFEKARFEIEWSEWSSCSSTCGPGMQTRYSRCVDDGSQLEMCLEAGSERTESRPCNTGPCPNSRAENDIPPTLPSGVESAAEVDAVTEYPVFTSTSADSNITVTAGNTEKRLTDEIYFPSDVYQPENRTIVGKKHRGGKLHGRKTPFVRSWDILKKKLLRESDSKKSWCSCLNGGTCDPVGNSCLCPEGYSGLFCENVGCQIDCLNGGKCLDSNVCICPSGFHGIRCENPQCNPPCRNGGTCIKPDICLCPPQTTGSYCQKYYCRSPCLNGGSCVGPDQCECPHNATGRNCESPVCEPPCENGATCSPGNWCLCSATSYGIRCERRKCDYVPIKEPFTRGFKRLVSKSNGGSKCEASTWKTCTRTVPEYQTVYKTFYRTVYKCREDLIGDGKEPK